MKKRFIALITLGITAAAALASIGSISYGLYSASARVNQGVGSAGVAKKSVYLCPNIWEVDSPLYVMHVFNSTTGDYEDLVPSKTVSITVSNIKMECKVFELDAVAYNSFTFKRNNPTTGEKWNQTDDIAWNGSTNVYRITSWDNGYEYHNSGYAPYTY